MISDRVKMYNHRYMDPSVDNFSLQRKVQFDIRFFFARRGSENMDKMRKTDFELTFDQRSETWFVKKVRDELTKNHRDREQIITGFMPENRDDPLCPVASFKKYIEHLNPENPYLWQKALESGNLKSDKNVWYSKHHIGRNTLGKFMGEVSLKCGLSKIYHNHSIRATGITVLTRMNYSNSQIMAISGHKSVQSLSIYQKTAQKEKLEMGNVLFQSVTKPEDQIIRPDTPQIESPPQLRALPPIPNQTATAPVTMNETGNNKENYGEIVPYIPNFEEDSVSDMDLLSAICGVDQNNKETSVATTTNSLVNNFPRAMFSNCGNVTIGTINFNINK